MSTFTINRPGAGKHRADDVIAERDQRIEQLAVDNEALIGANEDLVCALAQAMVRGCQDSMRIARLETELAAAVAEVKRLQQKTIRDAADKQRLRQAVVDARPRITEVVQRLDRPYVSHVQIPYPVPVGRDMSADETQQLPIVDQSEPEPWPTYSVRPSPAA